MKNLTASQDSGNLEHTTWTYRFWPSPCRFAKQTHNFNGGAGFKTNNGVRSVLPVVHLSRILALNPKPEFFRIAGRIPFCFRGYLVGLEASELRSPLLRVARCFGFGPDP